MHYADEQRADRPTEICEPLLHRHLLFSHTDPGFRS